MLKFELNIKQFLGDLDVYISLCAFSFSLEKLVLISFNEYAH